MMLFSRSLCKTRRRIRRGWNFRRRSNSKSASNRPVPSEVVMPKPSCPVASQMRSLTMLGPMIGNLSGVAARWPVQVRMAESFPRRGQIFQRAPQHAVQNWLIHRAPSAS